MFGYIRPYKPDLRFRDFEWFRAAYCGVCHALSRRYGFPARLILRYDFAFLALVLQEGPTICAPRRCPVHPFRKRCPVLINAACESAADAGVLLACGKWEDTVRDEGFWRSLPARGVLRFFARRLRKAAARRPVWHQTLQSRLQALHALEALAGPSLDAPADAFARALEAFAPEGDRIRQQILYHVGRWLYITDAADDYEADVKRGRYNAVQARFNLREKTLPQEVQAELAQSLSLSCEQALLALRLLPETPGTPVLENILAQGLPHIFENVMKRNLPDERRL